LGKSDNINTEYNKSLIGDKSNQNSNSKNSNDIFLKEGGEKDREMKEINNQSQDSNDYIKQ